MTFFIQKLKNFSQKLNKNIQKLKDFAKNSTYRNSKAQKCSKVMS